MRVRLLVGVSQAVSWKGMVKVCGRVRVCVWVMMKYKRRLCVAKDVGEGLCQNECENERM